MERTCPECGWCRPMGWVPGIKSTERRSFLSLALDLLKCERAASYSCGHSFPGDGLNFQTKISPSSLEWFLVRYLVSTTRKVTAALSWRLVTGLCCLQNSEPKPFFFKMALLLCCLELCGSRSPPTQPPEKRRAQAPPLCPAPS